MKFNFTGEISGLSTGIEIMSKKLNFETDNTGILVNVIKSSSNNINVIFENLKKLDCIGVYLQNDTCGKIK